MSPGTNPGANPESNPRLAVAVGVVIRADGQVLLGQRVAGKPYAGWWEFPGGKVEAGETVAQALARELQEELGLRVSASHPWLVREFIYPHAHVRLHFRRIFGAWGDFGGEPQSREGQAFDWLPPDNPRHSPLLPATVPVFGWLTLPPVFVADAPDTVVLSAAQLRGLNERPAARRCAARCESAAEVTRAGELGLDCVLAREIFPDPALPLYLEGASMSLREAIAAGAHGLA